MKLIESKVEIIEQQPGLDGVYKQIELAGRTCYKSEDKITEDSAKGFVDRMIGSKHGAMLEHGTVYLKGRAIYDENGILEVPKNLFPGFFERNKYSIVRKIESEDMCNWYITTNLRVIVENNLTEVELKPVVCDGIEQCKAALTKAKLGVLDANFIEGMACVDGCIGGAGCLKHGAKNKASVDKYGKEALETNIHSSLKNIMKK